MWRGGTAALGGCLLALAIVATPALATTDRLGYADQANPICKSSNKQTEDLYTSTEAEIDRLYAVHPKNRKQARRLRRRRDQLEEQLPFQTIGIYQTELDQLKALVAPPGYEDTVASWLGTRQRIADLYLQVIQIDREEETGFDFHKRPTRKAVKRRQKRMRNLDRLYQQSVDQLLIDVQTDLELGTRMGAAYCVTGATGHLPDGVIDPDE